MLVLILILIFAPIFGYIIYKGYRLYDKKKVPKNTPTLKDDIVNNIDRKMEKRVESKKSK